MLQPRVKGTTLTSLGIMSGSSDDGIDTAIVRVDFAHRAVRAQVLAARTEPYTPDVRHLLDNVARMTAADLSTANFLLGDLFAGAANRTIRESHMAPDEIDLIASHGHTVHHDGGNATLQIGEGAVIAHRTGRITVTDFRAADVAAGGQGAPLVPRVDALLLCPPGSNAAALNIGGIANLTYCRARGGEVIAFDSGPGNGLIDAATRHVTHGACRYDAGGARAGAGTPNEEAARRFIDDEEYFQRPPPKSIDRERFGDAALARLLAGARFDRAEDLVATATWITARTIVEAVDRFLAPAGPVERILLSGGGAHNTTLMAWIGRWLPDTPVRPLDRHGFTVDNKEAAAFAILGAMTLRGLAGNVPSATGAARPAILGKISFPYAQADEADEAAEGA